MKNIIFAIFLVLQFSTGIHRASAAEAYQPPTPQPAEYLETQDDAGNPKIYKRDTSSAPIISPLVCIYFHGNISSGGPIPVGGFIVGYGPYTSGCVGTHTFDILSSAPPLALLSLRLEKQSGSSWVSVASGWSIYYPSAPTGVYRVVILNGGSAAATTWSAKYSIPN